MRLPDKACNLTVKNRVIPNICRNGYKYCHLLAQVKFLSRISIKICFDYNYCYPRLYFIFIVVIYYVLGVLCFGIARSRPIAASLLFPLDFTAAGGLSTIVGYVRILYGLYLEGAVTIAAIMVAILRVSATQSLTNIGLKYGLLTKD